MFLDAATLQDLDVLPMPNRRGTTLWSMVDRTRTRAGARALRQRLRIVPSSTADEILALQRAHRALAIEDSYRTVLDQADLDGVERYLAATWQLPGDMPGLARFKTWYRHYLKDIDQGRTSVAGLLAAAGDLRGRLVVAETPVLRQVGERLTALLEAPSMREVASRVTRPSVAPLRAFDQVARGDARLILEDVVQCIATVEALWSMGRATIEHGWSYPQPSTRLRVIGLVHPLLGAQAVPNDLRLNDRVRVCFVTGPNMAGKSTFLKAVAIAILLAHSGCGVPATSMEFPIVATLFSSVNVEDDIGAGESFYLAEIRRIAALAEALCDHGAAVAVIDEPFRGTNVHDAAEATLAVITRLAGHPSAIVFVASHVGEIVPAIVDNPGVALFNFAADVTADRPRFDYRLRDGVCTQRLGMTLLRQEGVLDRLDRSVKPRDVQAAQALERTART